MVNLIEAEEIKEIFDNFEKLKKKSEGTSNSDEARVSQELLFIKRKISANFLIVLLTCYREYLWPKNLATM